VRGVDGVQAEWVAMKKDWKELKRRQKRAADNAEKNDKRSKVAHYTERFDNLKKVLVRKEEPCSLEILTCSVSCIFPGEGSILEVLVRLNRSSYMHIY